MLQVLDVEGRAATVAEQRVVARWGGWGAEGVAQVLDDRETAHAGVREELLGLIGEEGLAAARTSTVNAHYTDHSLAAAIWTAVRTAGFTGGRVLEPGCGAGVFLGLAPEGAELVGVELDPATARVARALNPGASIRCESFADTRWPAGWFDLAIGNVPFGDVRLRDPVHNPDGLAIHNHFIVKSLDLVAPGGLVAVVTSSFTMDAKNPGARRAMAERADLVAAVRLPNGAHRRAAGTEALTDVLVFRRREDGREPADLSWTGVEERVFPVAGTDETQAHRVNRWWAAHPGSVLGSEELAVGLHGVFGLRVRPLDVDLVRALELELGRSLAVAADAGLSYGPTRTAERAPAPVELGLLDGEIVEADGGFARVAGGRLEPLKVPGTQTRELGHLLRLKAGAKGLLGLEAASFDDTPELDRARADLRADWEAYVARFGALTRLNVTPTGLRLKPPAVRLLLTDPAAAIVVALERFEEGWDSPRPASVLLERQIVPRGEVLGVDTAADGLAVVLDEVGRVDVGRIADLMGASPGEVVAELGDLVFEDPAAEGVWHTRASYLSGNVRSKLDEAVRAAVEEPDRWGGNVAALRAALPADIQMGDIVPRLGAVWIPDTDVQQFLRELLGAPADPSIRVERSAIGSDWDVEVPGRFNIRREVSQDWGTGRAPLPDLLRMCLTQQPIAVFDTFEERDRDGALRSRRVFNLEESTAAQEKADQLQARFTDWLWEDPGRAVRLVADYNRRFNSTVLRSYEGEGGRLRLPGLAASFTPTAHQRAAVARILAEPSVGLFHEVGAGKTASMVIGATELKRVGLIHKPCVVVPNHMLLQFASEWLRLYPRARLLVADSDDTSARRRREFVARVSANDWDAVIMTRSAFSAVPLSPAAEAQVKRRELDRAREQLSRAGKDGGGLTLKRIEKQLLRMEQQIDALTARRVDPGMTFEETGVDCLVIDEIHGYKNLATVSRVEGAQVLGSKRAFDLLGKLEFLRGRHGGRNVLIGATATPISNSMVELHTMQRYFDPQGLLDAGIDDFDSWAATFGEVVTAPELASDGVTFKPKSRLARFVNVPELLGMFHRFGDVKTAADLDLPRPRLSVDPDSGERRPRTVLVEPDQDLKAYISRLTARIDEIRSGRIDPTSDNMLKVMTDGRHASLDLRLRAEGVAGGLKVDAAADRLAQVWRETKDQVFVDPATGEPHPVAGALQIVFCDLSTPKPGGFSVYRALKDALIDRGLPEGRVRFVHEASTPEAKQALFDQCRSGRVAVLIGSTERMGVGTNIQDRAVHLLHLDAPWKPAELEQRNGRIWRQGNLNPEVTITNVIVTRSFDAMMWQTLHRKSQFIADVMSGHLKDRVADDIDDAPGDVRLFGELKAAASGNPDLIRQAELTAVVNRLTALERAHRRNALSIRHTLATSDTALREARDRLAGLDAMAARTRDTHGDNFSILVADLNRGGGLEQGRVLTSRADAAEHLASQARRLEAVRDTAIASFAGHTVLARSEPAERRWPYTDQGAVVWSLEGSDINRLVKLGHGQPLADLGTLARLQNMVDEIAVRRRDAAALIQELEHTITQYGAIGDPPFTRAVELEAARRDLQTIDERIQRAAAQATLPAPSPPTVEAEATGVEPPTAPDPPRLDASRAYAASHRHDDRSGIDVPGGRFDRW
ncbi:MAG: helicase [Propionibacteriaceae bacterium]|nr:helicase [Propionibacteriaceae bacterium]